MLCIYYCNTSRCKIRQNDWNDLYLVQYREIIIIMLGGLGDNVVILCDL